MKFAKSKLANGIRVVTVPRPSLASVTLTVWVKTGSRLEDAKVNGISHFLEHMTFKGSKKRPLAKDISEAVDAIGGEFNAATSKDWTNFYIKARAESLPIAFDVLSDMILNPLLRKEEIEREKGVIIEELAMYEDTPLIKIQDVFEELTFAGNPLSWDVGGKPETVRSIKRDDFVRYRDIHYYAENIIITVAGGVTEKEVVDLATKYFGKLKSRQSKVKPAFNKFSAGQAKPQIKLHSKKKEQAHFVLGFLGNKRGYKGRFVEAVLSAILGGGMSSRLFIEVRERRGLAYAVKNGIERFDDCGYISTYVGADVKRVDEAIKVVLDEHYKLSTKEKVITKKELQKAKEYIKGHIALALEDTKDVNELVGINYLFLGKVETPEEIFRKIDKVTAEEVVSEAKKLFVPRKLNLAIIGPYKNAARFERLLH